MTKADDSILLARIDERTQHMLEDTKGLREDFGQFRTEVKKYYVSRTEFAPVKAVVYGLVGTVLLSVVGTALAFVFAT